MKAMKESKSHQLVLLTLTTRKMKSLLSLLIALLFTIVSTAQTHRPEVISDSHDQSVMTKLQNSNQKYYGMQFGAFDANTPDGKLINNKTLVGKVSLILFWDPHIGYSNRKYDAGFLRLHLNKLGAFREQYKDFQIISLLADTSDLALFQQQNPDVSVFTVAKLTHPITTNELNPGQGTPSCVLVDRYGNVARMSYLGGSLFDEQAMADKVKELVMQ